MTFRRWPLLYPICSADKKSLSTLQTLHILTTYLLPSLSESHSKYQSSLPKHMLIQTYTH